MHCAFKLGIGSEVIDNHSKLNKNSVADQLSWAALQYLKGEFEEAIDIYKRIYMDKKFDALNIYLAMCYLKEEYFDIALDLVNHYLTIHKDSIVANNLKAVLEYSANGNYKAAQNHLLYLQEISKSSTSNILEDSDLLKHNMAVFDNEETSSSNKLKVFSSLIDVIPEAKLNLIIYYLRNEQVNQAYALIKDIQPNSTKEYILKAVVHCMLGQQGDKNQEHLKKAQTYFQSIGASASECDTIEGRQCMASCFRLNGMHSDELIYLESIEAYLKDDDDFNWNYGISLAACQKYKEAELVLARIKKERYKSDNVYLSWICRCYIMNGKPEFAWNLYISIENHLIALYILNFIAHEFYRMGHFYFSYKAFLFLEKFSPSSENTTGKTSSVVGVFYQLISGKIGSERMQEVFQYLSEGTQTEEIKKIVKEIKKWGKENGYNFSEQVDFEGAY
jgi:intraflagellar transport protein 56